MRTANVLVLGPFKGTMTPHTRIALNQGICAAAAFTGKTIVIDDVSADPRYLACSLETKSEIVVPVFVHNRVAGELDIDSHFLAAFGPDDRKIILISQGRRRRHNALVRIFRKRHKNIDQPRPSLR